MKKKILLLCLAFTGLISFAQETTLDKISKETCEYLSALDLKTLSSKEKNMELGLYIIKLYTKYEAKLKEEGIFMDLTKGKQGGAEFGEKIGVNMIKFCPDVLIALASEDAKSEEVTSAYLEGTIKKISGEELYTVEIKDTTGKTQKLIWLNNFEGSDELIELEKKAKGKSVKVSYENIEYFSPKLKEYIVRKKITKVEFL